MVFVALREAQARDEQRQEILRAYDESRPRLAALGEESETLQVQWRELDRRAAAFTQQAGALAEKLALNSRERMTVSAAFEGRVAAVLDENQWRTWQDFWLRPAFGRDEAGGFEAGGSGGRGSRRR